jgi:spore coat protein U-like protein
MSIFLGRKNVRARNTIVVSLLGKALAFCAFSFASGAAAASVETVKLDISASIPARCGLIDLAKAPLTAADLTQDASMTLPFKVDCNQPFVIRMSSSNGGMRYLGEGDSFGFMTFKPYEVALDVGLSGGSSLSRSCGSTALNPSSAAAAGEGMGVGCEFYGTAFRTGLSSGDAIAASDAGPSSLKISWRGASIRRMRAGSYQDTLTIVVEPRS